VDGTKDDNYIYIITYETFFFHYHTLENPMNHFMGAFLASITKNNRSSKGHQFGGVLG